MIKVSDYVVKRLVHHGVKDVFMISGGGAMHLNDSVGKCRELNYICNHHEQASAIAAEGYARSSGHLAVVIVTTGPGGTNTLTGVMGQWTDSIPVLYISGQVKLETTVESCRELGLRQIGDQEINIVDIVSHMTKFAAIVRSSSEVKLLLDKAIHFAMSGRPGPVWIDIPLNIQGALVDENLLEGYLEQALEDVLKMENLSKDMKKIIKLLKNSKRPIFVAGHGIRLAKAQSIFLELVEKIGMPVVSTFNGFDLIPSNHPLFVGRIGTIGDRAGNFALQNADLLLCVGSRNNIRQISYNWQAFARTAKKIIVDIDPAELKKTTVKPDLPINTDARNFLECLREELLYDTLSNWKDWRKWTNERKNKYPVVLPEYYENIETVNPYCFIKELTENLDEDIILVAGNGTACVTLFQAGIVKKRQRIFWNSGCASMGYDLPAAIGASFANKGKEIICLAGDGSLQMNIQELQTVVHYQFPIKIFVLNNNGYASIRQTQTAYFEGRMVACDKNSGVSFPDMSKISSAYGLPYEIIKRPNEMSEIIQRVLQMPGPVVCEVQLTTDYIFSPKLSSERKPDGQMVSKPLEDMYPFLDRDEFRTNMIVPEWQL